MRPAIAPETAIPIPPGGLQPQEQLTQITSIQTEVDRENTTARANFAQGCSTWTVDNLRNRDMKLALTAKPVPPIVQTVKTAADVDANGMPATSGIVWLWIETSQLAACPDLPPVPVAPGPNHIHIGRRIWDKWFAAGQDDTYPVDGPPVQATSDDGVSGTFARSASPVGNGWWMKVA